MPIDENLKNLSLKPEGYYVQTRPEMVDFIPNNAKRILDVGCGCGVFGAQLKAKFNAEVWGIELDGDSAILAKERIDRIFVGDAFQLVDDLPDGYFDCIVFNDVLEHLIDPFNLLLKVKCKLAIGGVIVCSIPNVRYLLTLIDLLVKKQWKYEDSGILDKTHLRFFTKKSIVDMFNCLDYEVINIKGINAIKSWKFQLLNTLSLGYLTDTRYLQFACIAKPKQ